METAETSPDPYKNIARDAYQIAQDMVLDSDAASEKKKRVIDRLANRLVEQASVEK